MTGGSSTDRDSISAEFARRFATSARVFRAPARINIIGEHTDYNDGLVFPLASALYTWVAAAPRPDRTLRVYSANFDAEARLELDALSDASSHAWLAYVRAVVTILQSEGLTLPGANLYIRGNIPLGGGLSSSASLETVLALALSGLAGIEIDPVRMALLCQRAEVEQVGVSCGIMDQYAVACSRAGHAMLLDCRALEHELVAMPKQAHLLLVDSGVKHQLNTGAYNRRRDECKRGLEQLQQQIPGLESLRDISLQQLEDARPDLDEIAYRRCRHVVSEIQRVRDARTAMLGNDAAALGTLISQSHDSLRDDFEVSCTELDEMVARANTCPGVKGSRMVGAGFGGCMLSLVDSTVLDTAVQGVLEESSIVLGKRPWHHIAEVCDGAAEATGAGETSAGREMPA